jgi:DNA-binding winged helix-turn-helix (wHTH) protein
MSATTGWFCTLLDAAPEVYFRYALHPRRRLVYVSPAVEALTGRTAAELYRDPAICGAIVTPGEGLAMRRMLRVRRPATLTLHVSRDEAIVPVTIRVVPVIRRRVTVAIEGVATLAASATGGASDAASAIEPVQQRLASLMFEVHGLLHRVLPAAVTATADGHNALRLGELALDPDRLIVTERGEPVALTSRELLVLRYLLERPGRVVTRQQLLTDVWAYSYTGDDRTVDVHISRLRRKLPSLRGRLVAIRNIGYRLDADAPAQTRAS